MSRKKNKKNTKKLPSQTPFFNEPPPGITCPITQYIFKEPVKLLLANDSDGGAVVEKEMYEQLVSLGNPRCPITRASIVGHLRMREIEHIVTWYLNICPQEQINQYQLGAMRPTPAVEQKPLLHDPGRIGAWVGIVMANIIYFSQYSELPASENLALMMLGSLCGRLVGETFAEEQPLLASLRWFESNPLGGVEPERTEVTAAVMERPGYFFS